MKLTYFDVRGRVEPVRLMLEMTRTSYEFVAIAIETWASPAGKPHFATLTPFGQLPVLEDDGFTLAQSGAIRRYVAQVLGLCGSSLREAARVDEVQETGAEIVLDLGTSFWRADFVAKRAEHREAMAQRLQALARYFEHTRADAEHWIRKDRYTLGDVQMGYALETVLAAHPGLLETYPELHHFTTRLFASDGIAEYVRSARRPRIWTVPIAPFGGKPEETHHWT
jgi:glutathione S-transferase